jgi:hypothetical protein
MKNQKSPKESLRLPTGQAKIKNQKLLGIIILIGLLFPLVSLAFKGGLVPCGGPGEPRCQICHLFVMLDTIIDFALFYIVFPVTTLLIVISGGMYMFSIGNPEHINKAKSILSSVIIGLVIIFSSWLIVNTFMTGIGLAEWVGGGDGWYRINCPI